MGWCAVVSDACYHGETDGNSDDTSDGDSDGSGPGSGSVDGFGSENQN
jgi:hypothetical protein